MLTQKSTTIGKINVELIVLSIAESVHLPELQAIPHEGHVKFADDQTSI